MDNLPNLPPGNEEIQGNVNPLISTPPPNPAPQIDIAASAEKPKNNKLIFALLGLFLLLASIPAAVYLAKQRQIIQIPAAGIGACDDGAGGCCDPTDAHNATCGCRTWEECTTDNGACSSGKSCCAKDGQGCSQNSDCCSTNCSNNICQAAVRTCSTCADVGAGYTTDSTCTANPSCATQNGFCCQKPDGKPVCCYSNCECFEGQTGNCEDRGNGKIWLKAGLTVSRIYKMTGSSVACPFSSSSQTDIKTNYTIPAGGEEFSLGDECGQIDAVGYCGSCKAGCFPPNVPTPTSTTQITCNSLIADSYVFDVNKTINFTVNVASTNPPLGAVYVKIGSNSLNLNIGADFFNSNCESGKPCVISATIPDDTTTRKLKTAPDLKAWVAVKNDVGTSCTTRPGTTPACLGSCLISFTNTPPFSVTCKLIKVYDSNWQEITNLANLKPLQKVYFVTRGDPFGAPTKARFRINGGAWIETETDTVGHLGDYMGDYYIEYTIPASGTYKVESEVYYNGVWY